MPNDAATKALAVIALIVSMCSLWLWINSLANVNEIQKTQATNNIIKQYWLADIDYQYKWCIDVNWETVCKNNEEQQDRWICNIDMNPHVRFLWRTHDQFFNNLERTSYKIKPNQRFEVAEFNYDTEKNDWPTHTCVTVYDFFNF